jgi:hypothetical protein
MSTRKLPEPIKPRTLKRARDGYGYITTDGRYEVTPAYSPTLQRGSAARPSFWVVKDTTGVQKAREYGDLRTVRELYCAPGGRVPWLVCDMDDGVMRVEPTRAAAVEWASSYACAPLRERHHGKGSTCYDYVFGHPGEDSTTSVFVMRADHASRHGFDPVQQPLHPFPDDPFEQVDRPAPTPEESAR